MVWVAEILCLGEFRLFGGVPNKSPIESPLVLVFGADGRGSVRDEDSLHQVDSIIFIRMDAGRCGRVRKAAK
jgi:hypothetical protein